MCEIQLSDAVKFTCMMLCIEVGFGIDSTADGRDGLNTFG